MKFYVVSMFLVVSGFIHSVYAEEASALEELTVSARPIGLQSAENLSLPISILDGLDLRNSQDSTIGETLSNIPGVTTDRFSPLASRPVIRGLAGSRVLILENCVGAMDVATISADHAVTIEPIQAEKIEIFRGPSTLLYGSEASGGLINVVTNRIPEIVPEFRNTFHSSYGDNQNEKLFSIQSEGGQDKWAYHLDSTKRHAREYSSSKKQIENSDYETFNFNVGTSYVDAWGFLGASIGYFESTHGVPLNPDDPSELPFLETEQNRFDLSGKIIEPWSGVEVVTLQAGYNDYTHTEFEDVGEAGTVFDNEEFSTRIEITHAQVGKLKGAFGTQFGFRNLSAVGEEAFIPKTKTNSVAAFILEEITLTDSTYLEIGGRYEHKEDNPNNASEVTNDMFSISTGLNWNSDQNMSLGINIGRSQRGPSADVLFANGPHVATGTFEVGDANLDVETSNTLDIILGKSYKAWQWNINLFANYVEDFIFLEGQDLDNDGSVDEVNETNTGTGEFQLHHVEQDDVTMYGFEVSLDTNIFDGNFGQLDLNLFSDYVRAVRSNGDNIARISPARFGSGLSYNYKKFDAGIDLTNVLAQKDNATLETATGGYAVLNMNANYNLMSGKQDMNIFLKMTNLLDEDGRMHTSFIKDRAPIMGRSVILGFQATF